MLNYNSAWIFVKVAESGSFTAAGGLLKLPKSTVSKKVAELEDELKVTLLKRSTRQVSLTEAGRVFFEQCSHAFKEINAAEARIEESRDQPSGLLRVGAPAEMTLDFVLMIGRFMAANPKVRVELILTDRLMDLVGENVDVALRAGELEDSSLIAKKLGTSRFQLYASSEYLKKAPPLKHPRDLSQHTCLHHTVIDPKGVWDFVGPANKKHRLTVNAPFSSTSVSALRTMVSQGLGVALLPALSLQGGVEGGSIVRVLPDWSSHVDPIHLVYPRQHYVSTNVRHFVDFMTKNWSFSDLPPAT